MNRYVRGRGRRRSGDVRGARLAVSALLAAVVVLTLIPAAQAAAGDLDPQFGAGGRVTQAFPGLDAVINDIAIQPDGGLVAVGWMRGGSISFAVARFGASGALDPTFDGDGVVTTSVGFGSVANAVAVQPDGKIVAAGSTAGFPGGFALVRYNADGSLDSSFGTGGRVTTNIGQPNSTANAVAIQPDGKIVVGGGNADFGPSAMNYVVARYLPNGALDGAFGSGGIAWTNFGTGGIARDLVIQPDGKIVEVGHTSPPSFPFDRFALVRFNANGTLDASFGSGGKVTTTFPGFSAAAAVVLQPDGKLVAAGGGFSSSNNGGFGLARYNGDGSLDTSFGDGGTVLTDFGPFGDSARDIALASDGTIVAAGGFVTPSFSGDFALARYTVEGALDTSFGIGGRVTTDFAGASEAVNAVAIQSDGKIVAAGVRSPSGHAEFALARYETGGDDVPPAIFVPPDITVDATSPDGAVVDYEVTAEDDVDGPVTPSCSPVSGSDFPVGTTTVECTATDSSGNGATASFDVTVLGATAQLENLIALATGVGPGTSLADKLNAALDAVLTGNPAEACSTLTAFANQVRAQSGKTLTVEQAEDFVAASVRIRAVLAC